jgi:hypothetical protein
MQPRKHGALPSPCRGPHAACGVGWLWGAEQDSACGTWHRVNR